MKEEAQRIKQLSQVIEKPRGDSFSLVDYVITNGNQIKEMMPSKARAFLEESVFTGYREISSSFAEELAATNSEETAYTLNQS